MCTCLCKESTDGGKHNCHERDSNCGSAVVAASGLRGRRCASGAASSWSSACGPSASSTRRSNEGSAVHGGGRRHGHSGGLLLDLHIDGLTRVENGTLGCRIITYTDKRTKLTVLYIRTQPEFCDSAARLEFGRSDEVGWLNVEEDDISGQILLVQNTDRVKNVLPVRTASCSRSRSSICSDGKTARHRYFLVF